MFVRVRAIISGGDGPKSFQLGEQPSQLTFRASHACKK